MNVLTELIEALDLASVWTYLGLFLGASWLLIWRLESLLKQGLEGTALGTLVMPYCSGLGNLMFVAIIAQRHGSQQDVLTNSLVNNVTNLTIVLGLPALLWGLKLRREGGSRRQQAAAETARQLDRLALLLTLAAVLFFSGATWVLARDGRLDRNDGLVLVALFLFWQCFQVFDVLKHNVRERRTFGWFFYLDMAVVLAGAYVLYVSIDWLVTWLSGQRGGFISAENLGWLSGWLMVLPNALLAFYYTARGRADVAYASQVGDGHISIPLCVGLGAIVQPMTVPPSFQTGLAILLGAGVVHFVCVAFADGLPRWMGWVLLGAYGWFVGTGFFQIA